MNLKIIHFNKPKHILRKIIGLNEATIIDVYI